MRATGGSRLTGGGVSMRHNYVSIFRAGNAPGGGSLPAQAAAITSNQPISTSTPSVQPATSLSLCRCIHPFAAIMSSQPQPQEPAEQANPSQPAGAAGAQQAEEQTGYAPLVDPRLPTRKDTSLKEFLAKIDDYAPIVSVAPPLLLASLCLVVLSHQAKQAVDDV